MTRARRVLYVVASSSIGGAETFLRHTARFHRPNRYEPVYALMRPGPLQEWLRADGFGAHLAPGVPRLRRPGSVASSVRWLRSLIEAERIDLVHSTMAYGALLGGPAARASRVPHVWFQHGPASGWMDRLAGLIPAEGMIVNSAFTGRQQARLEKPLAFLRDGRRKNLLLPLGVDLAQPAGAGRREWRERWGAAEATCVFGMLCRPQRWKGVDLLLEALAKARGKAGGPILGVVMGGSAADGGRGAYERELRLAAERSGGLLRFGGPTDDVPGAIRAMDVVVNASRTPEPFGLSIVEGMAAGKPVVVPDEGGPLEIVRPGIDGLLFHARDGESLAAALARLAADRPLRESLGLAAREAAELRFDARRCVEKMEDFYDGIFATSAPAITGHEK